MIGIFLLSEWKLISMSGPTVTVNGHEFDAESTVKAIEAAIERGDHVYIYGKDDMGCHGHVMVWGDDHSDTDGYIADTENESVITSYTNLKRVMREAKNVLDDDGDSESYSRGRAKLRLSNIDN